MPFSRLRSGSAPASEAVAARVDSVGRSALGVLVLPVLVVLIGLLVGG